jgi:hypothetical protein
MTTVRQAEPNPFPRKTVATESIDRVPTYEGIAFKEAETKLIEGSRRLNADETPLGAALGLRGQFGSGKTHTCLMLKQSFTKRLPMGKSLYVKILTADRFDLYRDYIGQNFHPEDFQRLISAHILVALQRQTTRRDSDTLSDIAAKELRERIEADPNVGIEFLREDLLPVADLLQSIQRETEESARALAADFSTAYLRIAHPLLGKLAIQWLQGNLLTLGEMRDLGVTLPGIQKPEQAWLALRFLLVALRQAELPLLLCIDEHERLTMRSADEEKKASWGLLKDLAEAFVSTGHLLLISGVSEAWDSLPDDVFARIRRQDVIEVSLDRAEVPKLLRAYSPQLDKTFSSSALERLYDAGQNNARRVLDLAHESYEIWQTDPRRPLGPDAIRGATRSALGDRSRKAGLMNAIEECARELALTFEKEANFRDVIFDYVLSSSERRRILIQISESAFLLDEIDHGREIISAQKRLVDEHDRIRTCAIMIGYSSLEVRDALERVVDRVLVYEEAKFRDNFRDFTSRALADMTAANPPIPVPQITDATRILDSAETVRTVQVEKTRAALDEAIAPQQRRQEELLAQQADEQMAACLANIEKSLVNENELLIRLTTKSLTQGDDRSEVIVRGVTLINLQYGGVKRARTITERENAGPSLSALIDSYRRELGQSEKLWPKFFRDYDGAIDDYTVDQIRNSLTTRRNRLHEIDEKWLKRRHKFTFAFSDFKFTIPLVLAALTLSWLVVDYWQISRSQRDAMDAYRDSLKGLIAFGLDYENTGALKQDVFSKAVTQFETVLLNPVLPNYQLPRDANTHNGGDLDKLQEVISQCRKDFAPDADTTAKQRYSMSSPREDITALSSLATQVLKSSYGIPNITFWNYLSVHGALTWMFVVLIIWVLAWPYYRNIYRS